MCYNGDIFTVEDYEKLTAAFPKVEAVMPVSYTHLDVYKRQVNDADAVFAAQSI